MAGLAFHWCLYNITISKCIEHYKKIIYANVYQNTINDCNSHTSLSPFFFLRGGGFQRLCVNVALLTADFVAMYTPRFWDIIQLCYDLTCHDLTPITWCMASQYINSCKNKGRREFCRGIRNNERNISSGWQGKLITKRHKCNKSRIPTNAFHLKRKALLHGKWQHDTEW